MDLPPGSGKTCRATVVEDYTRIRVRAPLCQILVRGVRLTRH
jgi:hypothetical protein